MDRRTYSVRSNPDPRDKDPFQDIEDVDWEEAVTAFQKSDALHLAVVFDGDAVQTAWADSELSHLRLISTNKRYRALPRHTWDLILAQHRTEHAYEEDFFDCDAFSVVFVGDVLWAYEINGVARVFDNSAHHSYNAVLVASDDGQSCSWQKVEPQADVFVDSPPAGVVLTDKGQHYEGARGFAVTA